jgi:hypothetical protein
MGLYGALTVDTAAGQVYGDPPSAYVNEVVLFYSEIDTGLHDAVATGNYGPGLSMTSTIDYTPTYHLVNGDPFPAGESLIPAGNVNEKLLIRFLNAGLKSHAPTLEGGHYMTVLAEDGYPYPYAKEQYSVYLPAGKTVDAVMTPGSTGYIPVYDRRLYLTNDMASPGGMLSYLEIASALQYTLQVNKSGLGTGTVSASFPGGIDCGATCSNSYNSGTQVQLTTAADGGSFFVGFTGNGCLLGGDCSVTMNSNITVSAIFSSTAPASIGVFRDGYWYLDTNGDGILGPSTYKFGRTGDTVVTGDWDGNGTTDIGLFRDGNWYLDNGDGAWNALDDTTYKLGRAGDVPVTGDWDGDNITEIGLFRDGNWFLDDGDGIWGSGPDTTYKLGRAGDVPVTGDWDSDNITEIGLFRNGNWYLDDGDGIWGSGPDASLKFGRAGDEPVVGDWDGDGNDEVGFFRSGNWYLDNGDGAWSADLDGIYQYGSPGDTPVMGRW